MLCSLFCPRSLFHHVLGFATTLPNHVARETPEVATHIPARGHLSRTSEFHLSSANYFVDSGSSSACPTRPLAKSLPASRPQSAHGPENRETSTATSQVNVLCAISSTCSSLYRFEASISGSHHIPCFRSSSLYLSASLLRPLAALTHFQVLQLHCDGSSQSLHLLPFLPSSCSTLPRPVSSCLEVFLEDTASSSTEVPLSASGAPPPPLSIQIQYSWRCFIPFPTHQPLELFTSASLLATYLVRCASRFSQDQHHAQAPSERLPS